MDLAQKLMEDVPEWPDRWKRYPKDIASGEKLVVAMTPFLIEVASSRFSATTKRRHFGYAWLLGGEIIDRLQDDEHLRSLTPAALLLHFLDDEGGPLCHHNSSETEHREYDSTCRKLRKFVLAHVENTTDWS